MLTILKPHCSDQPFPDVGEALAEPNGLLAVGGCLSPRRLQNAYRNGIFPWYSEGEPILWWSPDPRLILWPQRLKISRSLGKILRHGLFDFSYNNCFDAVVEACSEPRGHTAGTWINPEMIRAYTEFHRLGYAHSFEAWQEYRLVGGLYGVALGQVFFGESMFHRTSNASKAAFAFAVRTLQHWGYQLIDCQVHTEHLISLGAEEISRAEFLDLLARYVDQPVSADAWQNQAIGP